VGPISSKFEIRKQRKRYPGYLVLNGNGVREKEGELYIEDALAWVDQSRITLYLSFNANMTHVFMIVLFWTSFQQGAQKKNLLDLENEDILLPPLTIMDVRKVMSCLDMNEYKYITSCISRNAAHEYSHVLGLYVMFPLVP
jgi:hypothetical protein